MNAQFKKGVLELIVLAAVEQKDSVTKKLQKQLKFPRLRSHLLSLRN